MKGVSLATMHTALPLTQRFSTRRLDIVALFILADSLGLIFLCMWTGDTLVFQGRPAAIPAHIWSLLDSPVHAALSLLVVSPFLLRMGWKRLLLGGLAAGAAAVLLDLDHFAAAGSFSLYQATHLSGRPLTHSLGFALACGLLAGLLTRNSENGLLIFGALISHILRDASTGGTPLLWPLDLQRIPVAVYACGQAVCFLIFWLAAANVRLGTNFRIYFNASRTKYMGRKPAQPGPQRAPAQG